MSVLFVISGVTGMTGNELVHQILSKDDDAKIKLAGRNIPTLSFLSYNRLRAHDLYYARKIIMLESAAKNLSEFYADEKEAK